MELEVGRVVGAQSDQGPVQFTVVEINDDIVIVDLNHQMAGYTLHFNVEIVEIREATPEELDHGHAHGPGHHHH
jgi:FKBP-type peptidyl-prolyl cis-trans isomerase SlyD